MVDDIKNTGTAPHEKTERKTIGINAHLLSLASTYRSAGVSRYIHQLMAHLPRVDQSLDYVAYTSNGQLKVPGWRTRRTTLPTERPAARVVWEQVAQPVALRRDRVDLIHAPVYVGPLATAQPMVVTIHDLSFFLFPELFPRGNRAYLQRFTRWTARRAAHVIADSQSTRADIQEILGLSRSKIDVIYPGVSSSLGPIRDPRRLTDLRIRYGLPDRFVLFVGTLEPRKNLVLLIEAMAHLAKQDEIGHTLVIAGGKGWFYEELDARVAELGLQNRVLMPGYVPDSELALWYSAADLLLYPSLYEGFGLPPLEAMACGTPVIVSSRSSLPEAVGGAGIKLPPEDPERWARTIAEVVSSPEQMASMREAGIQRASLFSWDATARATADVYHLVLDERI